MTSLKNSRTRPLVSVVTSCYNGEEHGMLNEYFKGLLSQSYDDIELIFVNDGSTDGTREVFFEHMEILEARLSRIIYIEFEENRGYIVAINTAIKHVSGEYICPFDSDDIMLPHKIQSHADFLNRNQEYGMVYSDGLLVASDDINKPLRTISSGGRADIKVSHEDILLQRVWPGSGRYSFRKDCWKDIGELSNEFNQRGQNLQIFVGIAYGHKIGFNDVGPVMKHVRRPDSLSNKTDLRNIYFKAITREKLDMYLISKYGASEVTKKEIELKYLKRKAVYYFLKNDDNLKWSYKKLKRHYKSKGGIKPKHREMALLTLIYMMSFSSFLNYIISKIILKTKITRIF